MDSETSRKIIVGGGMAAVLGIGVVAYALLSHPTSAPTPAAQISQPPASVAPTPDVPAAVAPAPDVAQIPAAPAAAAPIPDAPAVAHKDSVGSKIGHTANPAAVEPKVTGNRRLAKAPTSADTTHRVVTPAEPTVDSSEKSAGDTPAKSVDGVKSVDEVPPPPAASGTTTNAQEGAASPEPAASDAGSPPK